MKLIVCLGNYPKEYDLTRHNVGFFIGNFIRDEYNFDDWKEDKKLICNITRGSLFSKDCLIIKPNTYMNNSGDSVAKVVNFYKIKPCDIVVIHDEIDLPFGIVKTTNSRNSAGHNGVKSINNVVKEVYNRVRIGVGRPQNADYDVSDYVLGKFTKEEQEKLQSIAEQSVLTIKSLF